MNMTRLAVLLSNVYLHDHTVQGVVEGMASLPLLGSVLATGDGANTLYHWIYSQRYVSLQTHGHCHHSTRARQSV